MSLFLVVIADVISSRNSMDMSNVYEHLLKVNADAKGELLVPFKCFRGDEIEAVLDAKTNFMKAIRTLKYRLQPLKVRVGLGIGRLDIGTDGLPNDPFLLNGEAFFEARDAIDRIKHKYKEQESIVLGAESNNGNNFDTWDIMLRLYSSIINRWNTDQWNAVMKYEKLDSMVDAANELNKKYQSVQRSLERADWNLICDCETWMMREMSMLYNRISNVSSQ